MKPRVYQFEGVWIVEYGSNPSDPEMMGFIPDPGEPREVAWRHALALAFVVGRVI